MKYCLFFLVIFYGTSFTKISYAYKSIEFLIPGLFPPQQEPIYFYRPVPSKILLLDKLDLSFFKSPLIATYRYKLEVPDANKSNIERKLFYWSVWSEDDLTEIVVPRLDVEGSYKLMIEYQTRSGTVTKRYEKQFLVYQDSQAGSEVTAVNKAQPATERATTETSSVAGSDNNAFKKTNNAAAQAAALTAGETVDQVKLANDSILKEKAAINEKVGDLSNVKIAVNNIPEIVADTEFIPTEPYESIEVAEKSPELDFDNLLTRAIESKDSALFSRSIKNGANASLTGENGGNIFHLLDDTIASEELIGILKNSGISIDKTDNYGNSPLHLAILSGKSRYAGSLINQGANLNIKNKMDLSPLHLAVFLNDEEVTDDLLKRGADINLKGNSGYTPLIIASEMNHINMAIKLLDFKASTRNKTAQGLSGKSVARIQRNTDMAKLIGKKGSYTVNLTNLNSSRVQTRLDSEDDSYPEIDFNLPYDRQLAKERHFNQVLQIITIPVIALGSAGTIYFRSRADHYYTLSKTAETEELAKQYYDKTTRNDNYTYIAVGLSLTSLYGLVHSTLKKKSVSRKMYKSF